MSISWKQIDEYTQAIYVEGEFIGEARANVLTQKWKMHPNFWLGSAGQAFFYKKYPSAYKCGKAMADLYSEYCALHDHAFDADRETQEIDMRGIFKRRRP